MGLSGSGEIDWDEFLEMIGTHLERESALKEFYSKDGPQRQPREAVEMVRLALDTVRADTRSIYGSMSRPHMDLKVRFGAEKAAMKIRCFFRPDGEGASVRFRRSWDIAQIIMLLYVALIVPFRIGFEMRANPENVMFWLEVVVDIYFWMDIFINFRTGVYDEYGELIIDQRVLCIKYATGWLALDVGETARKGRLSSAPKHSAIPSFSHTLPLRAARSLVPAGNVHRAARVGR